MLNAKVYSRSKVKTLKSGVLYHVSSLFSFYLHFCCYASKNDKTSSGMSRCPIKVYSDAFSC